MGRDLALLTDRLDDAEIESRALRRESRRRDGEDLDGLDLEELTALAGRLEVATARVEAARARALADVEAARRRAAVSEDLLCPISFEVMSDPVILADGHSRAAASPRPALMSSDAAASFAATRIGAVRRFNPTL